MIIMEGGFLLIFYFITVSASSMPQHSTTGPNIDTVSPELPLLPGFSDPELQTPPTPPASPAPPAPPTPAGSQCNILSSVYCLNKISRSQNVFDTSEKPADAVERLCRTMNTAFLCIGDKMNGCTGKYRLLYDTAVSAGRFLCNGLGKQGFIDNYECLFSERYRQTSNGCSTNVVTGIVDYVMNTTITTSGVNDPEKICSLGQNMSNCIMTTSLKACGTTSTRFLKDYLSASMRPLRQMVACDPAPLVNDATSTATKQPLRESTTSSATSTTTTSTTTLPPRPMTSSASKCDIISTVYCLNRMSKSQRSLNMIRNPASAVEGLCRTMNTAFLCIGDKMNGCTGKYRLLYDTAVSAGRFLCNEPGKQGFIENYECLFSERYRQSSNGCSTNVVTGIVDYVMNTTMTSSGVNDPEEICRLGQNMSNCIMAASLKACGISSELFLKEYLAAAMGPLKQMVACDPDPHRSLPLPDSTIIQLPIESTATSTTTTTTKATTTKTMTLQRRANPVQTASLVPPTPLASKCNIISSAYCLNKMSKLQNVLKTVTNPTSAVDQLCRMMSSAFLCIGDKMNGCTGKYKLLYDTAVPVWKFLCNGRGKQGFIDNYECLFSAGFKHSSRHCTTNVVTGIVDYVMNTTITSTGRIDLPEEICRLGDSMSNCIMSTSLKACGISSVIFLKEYLAAALHPLRQMLTCDAGHLMDDAMLVNAPTTNTIELMPKAAPITTKPTATKSTTIIFPTSTRRRPAINPAMAPKIVRRPAVHSFERHRTTSSPKLVMRQTTFSGHCYNCLANRLRIQKRNIRNYDRFCRSTFLRLGQCQWFICSCYGA